MKLLAKLFFRGLAAILPLALTGYLVWWLVTSGERLLHDCLVLLFGQPWADNWYHDGMGFLLAITVVMTVGLLMYSWVVRQVYQRVTALLERIPVVKSVYGMIVDVVRLFGTADERPFRKVVLVKVENSFEQIGFLTRDNFDDIDQIGDGQVAVYLPMSYQLGGFTVIVPADKIREIDMSVEDALRFCVTAGVKKRA